MRGRSRRSKRSKRTKTKKRVRSQRGGTNIISWIILQADDRHLDESYRRAIDINKLYASKHGYAYRFESTASTMLPPVWKKVEMAKNALKENPGCKGVLWLDTDAFVVGNEQTIDSLFSNQSYDMVVAPDPPDVGAATINVGVWAIRNTVGGRKMLEDWMSVYSPNYWKLENGKWDHVNTTWGYDGYEQGEFISKIFPKYKSHIYIAPWQLLQADKKAPDTFTIHALGNRKKNMKSFLNSTT